MYVSERKKKRGEKRGERKEKKRERKWVQNRDNLMVIPENKQTFDGVRFLIIKRRNCYNILYIYVLNIIILYIDSYYSMYMFKTTYSYDIINGIVLMSELLLVTTTIWPKQFLHSIFFFAVTIWQGICCSREVHFRVRCLIIHTTNNECCPSWYLIVEGKVNI